MVLRKILILIIVKKRKKLLTRISWKNYQNKVKNFWWISCWNLHLNKPSKRKSSKFVLSQFKISKLSWLKVKFKFWILRKTFLKQSLKTSKNKQFKFKKTHPWTWAIFQATHLLMSIPKTKNLSRSMHKKSCTLSVRELTKVANKFNSSKIKSEVYF